MSNVYLAVSADRTVLKIGISSNPHGRIGNLRTNAIAVTSARSREFRDTLSFPGWISR